MPSQNLLSLLAIGAVFAPWVVSNRRRARLARRSAFADRLLWAGLAAGLFDSEEGPATSRLEIALAALARKLGLRAGIVTVHGRDDCVVVATAGLHAGLLRGLARGSVVPRASLFCGKVQAPGQALAIDYATLSEWRSHPAARDRGWESYLAVHCGLEQGEDLVVAFFDTVPRGTAFTRAERTLVQQLAPWIAAMVGESSGAGAGRAAGGTETVLRPG